MVAIRMAMTTILRGDRRVVPEIDVRVALTLTALALGQKLQPFPAIDKKATIKIHIFLRAVAGGASRRFKSRDSRNAIFLKQ
jgi:hypothetical protein